MEHTTKEALIAEITAAFSGVKLGNGVSWREADVIDDYGSKEQRRLARAQDEKEDWTKIPLELIGDLRYQAVLSFLDTAGLKYYLPICMIYFLKKGHESGSAIIDAIIFTLTDEKKIMELTAHLDKRQIACVRSFLLMDLETIGYFMDGEKVRKLIDEYWSGE